MVKLNPYALSQRRRQILASQKSGEKRRAKVQRSRINPDYLKNVLLGPQAILVKHVKHVEVIDEGTNVPVSKMVEEEEEEPKPKVEEKKPDDKKNPYY